MDAQAHEFPPKTIAAIDIGTNSAHLVVAEMDHVGEMRVLDNDKVTLRLGEAIDSDGNITDHGIAKTVEAIKHMKEIASSYPAIIRAVATHATREARNHRELEEAIFQNCGIRIEIIDGIEEARLVFLGMRYGLSLYGVSALGIDIGGGSTELIIANDDDVHYVTSAKLGAVTLTTRYFPNGQYTRAGLVKLRDHIRSRLAPLPQEARRARFDRALAASGTAKALCYTHARLFGNGEISDPNGYVFPSRDLLKMSRMLTDLLTPEKIKERTGLDSARAEIILAGAVIFEEVSSIFKVKEWQMSSYGLREGLVADTFYRTYGRRSGALPDIQWHSVLQFAKRLGLNESHARQIRKLSLRLYDQIAPVLRKDDSDDQRDGYRKLLEAASYLREAGKFLSAPRYHKHSYYLIKNSRLLGFTEDERELMGLVARYQRKSLPSKSSRDCQDLPTPQIKLLRFLSGILRLASALDRSRKRRIHDIHATFENNSMVIELLHDRRHEPDVEMHKASLEREALEKSLGVNIKFKTKELY